jgi:hypothetical protein
MLNVSIFCIGTGMVMLVWFLMSSLIRWIKEKYHASH